MIGVSISLIWVLFISVLLFALQFLLCKRTSKGAIILPLIVACFFIILGLYALFIAAIMFGIYFVMRYIEKEKERKLSEIEKMNIQDLD